MKHLIRLLPIVALALLTTSSLARAEKDTAGHDAYAALGSYFDGEITREEVDAALDPFLSPRTRGSSEPAVTSTDNRGVQPSRYQTPDGDTVREIYWETVGVCDANRNGAPNPHYNQILCAQYRQEQDLAARLAEWQANPPTPYCTFSMQYTEDGPVPRTLHVVPDLATGEYIVTVVTSVPANFNCSSTTPGGG